MKTVIANKSVWPKFEPWEPYQRDSLGRVIPDNRKPLSKRSNQLANICFDKQIKKHAKALRNKQ